MLTSFILYVVSLLILTITGFYMSFNFFDWRGLFGGCMGLLSSIALLFIIAGSICGDIGFDTYDIKTTENFTKAIATDHSSVTIIYDKQPYVFEQFNVVNNFDTITNIVVAEKKNLFGFTLNTAIQILTPKYKSE